MGICTHQVSVAAGRLVGALLVFALGWGCTGPLRLPAAYQYFALPDPDDAWSRKIGLWQQRERVPLTEDRVRVPASVAGWGGEAGSASPESESLKAKYDAFRTERKRAIAREFADWLQQQAHKHYVPDGPVDHWATLEETFRSNGDDCDGLELLTYHFLRDLGFGDDAVYRAVVVRKTDGQHHMVTLWFEDPEDPWVIDPTGAMASGMLRMSALTDWVPIKVFSEDRDFTVRHRRLQSAHKPVP
ncbi:MAG: hypothetical protein OEM05_05965 [Myxococcales bacterium]|nr:hypothetical protein [Myxococcales bacterium]